MFSPRSLRRVRLRTVSPMVRKRTLQNWRSMRKFHLTTEITEDTKVSDD
jgi:hypothetical protein